MPGRRACYICRLTCSSHHEGCCTCAGSAMHLHVIPPWQFAAHATLAKQVQNYLHFLTCTGTSSDYQSSSCFPVYLVADFHQGPAGFRIPVANLGSRHRTMPSDGCLSWQWLVGPAAHQCTLLICGRKIEIAVTSSLGSMSLLAVQRHCDEHHQLRA